MKTIKNREGVEKMNKEIVHDLGGTFLSINWDKQKVHYLSASGNKRVISITLPEKDEKKD